MVSFATPLSVCVQRRNPTRIPRRDFLVQSSDTATLAITVYQQDTDTQPIDVTDATLTLSLYREPDVRLCRWWDYGWQYGGPYVLAQVQGQLADGPAGRIDIPLMAVPSQWITGRLAYELTMNFGLSPITGIGVPLAAGASDYPQGNLTLLSGIVEFQRGAIVPVVQLPELLGQIGVAS